MGKMQIYATALVYSERTGSSDGKMGSKLPRYRQRFGDPGFHQGDQRGGRFADVPDGARPAQVDAAVGIDAHGRDAHLVAQEDSTRQVEVLGHQDGFPAEDAPAR